MNLAIEILNDELKALDNLLGASMAEIQADSISGSTLLAETYAPMIAKTQDLKAELKQAIELLKEELNS